MKELKFRAVASGISRRDVRVRYGGWPCFRILS